VFQASREEELLGYHLLLPNPESKETLMYSQRVIFMVPGSRSLLFTFIVLLVAQACVTRSSNALKKYLFVNCLDTLFEQQNSEQGLTEH
jgi:hypothetical protein